MTKQKTAKTQDPKGTVAAFQIDKDTKKVETLNGFTLVDNGARVYSSHNKPTSADLGVLPLSGGTITGTLDVTGHVKARDLHTAAAATDGSFTTIKSESSYSMFFKNNGAIAGKSSEFIGIGADHILYRKDNGTKDSKYTDYRVYHQGYKPTAADVGALASNGTAVAATKLASLRQINGTNFDGTANITTSTWGNARTLTIGGTGKSVNGTANVSWTLSEIGAVPSAGGTVTGVLTLGNRLESSLLGSSNKQIMQANSSDFVYVGNPTIKRVYLQTDTDGAAYVAASSTSHRIYHAGYKPSAADVGALALTGGTVTGNVVVTGAVRGQASQGIRTDVQTTDGSHASISAQSGYVMLWKNNNSSTSADEFIGIRSNSLIFRRDAKKGDKTYEDHTVYHTGNKPSAADVGAVGLSGGTMTGDLKIGINKRLYFPTTTYASGAQIWAQNQDQYGSNLVISSGGATVLSSGESGIEAGKQMTAGTLATQEKMYITSDSDITFLSNCNAWDGRKTTILDTTGKLTLPAGVVVGDSAKAMSMGFGASDTWVLNTKSNKYLQLRDNGDLDYGSKQVFVDGDPRLSGKMISYSKSLTTEDLDTLKTAGVYRQTANANATTERHYPEANAGSLIITEAAGVLQTYHCYNSSKIYTRGQYSTGGWTPWKRMINNTDDVNSNPAWSSLINKIPRISGSGVIELGRYIDFHKQDSTADYDVRVDTGGGIVRVQNSNGYVEMGALNSSFGHIYTDRAKFAMNKEVEVAGNVTAAGDLVIKKAGRKHLTFSETNGTVDGHIWKDSGKAWVLGHGATAQCDMSWSQNGELMLDGNRWSSTHAHSFTGQPGLVAPITVAFGVVPGNSDYYPIVRGISQASGHGYTTQVDFGHLRDGGAQWGKGVLRVGSHESGSHPSAIYYFDINGHFTAVGNGSFADVYIRSDKRLKSNLTKIGGALDKVSTLQAYTYDKHKDLNDSTVVGREAGIIAQDLQKVLPEAVNEAEDSMLTISNSAVNALLLEAIKELKAQNEILVSRIEKLEKANG